MPRLAKGELAPSVKLRANASAASAEARIARMLELKARGAATEQEATAFSSFEALCRHVDTSRGIFVISPKTLRKHVATNFFGGPEAFRSLMQSLSNSSEQSAVDGRQPKKPAVASIATQTDAVLEMSARYADLVERMAKLAMEFPRARVEFQAHLRVFPESAGHLRRIK